MPEPVDRNPDLDTAVDALRERLGDAFVAGLRVAVVRDADLRLVLDALAEYRRGAVPDTGHPAAADLPARLRFAYAEAAHLGWHGVAATLLDLAGQLEPGDDDDSDEVCAAIARALASASPSGDTPNTPEESR